MHVSMRLFLFLFPLGRARKRPTMPVINRSVGRSSVGRILSINACKAYKYTYRLHLHGVLHTYYYIKSVKNTLIYNNNVGSKKEKKKHWKRTVVVVTPK